MRPCLQCEAAARHDSGQVMQRLPIRAHTLFQLYLTSFIQYAVATVAISQIQPDGESLPGNIPALSCAYGASLPD